MSVGHRPLLRVTCTFLPLPPLLSLFCPLLTHHILVLVPSQKGPIKVYALGLYSPSDAFDAPDEPSLWSKLRLSKSGDGARGIVCVLTFKVSAQKMSGALIDSLKPRFKGPSSALDALSDKIVEGCSGGGGKGTVFEFLCESKDKIRVSVNGNDQGVVEASNVGGAFADIYLDEKGVR